MNKELFERAYELLKNPVYCFDNGQGDILDCETFEEADILYECGASRIALILDDCVLKKPYTGFCEWTEDNDNPIAISEAPENQGSCETEALIYKLAEERGLEKFFAKSEYLGDEIFKQERAEELVVHKISSYSIPKDFEERCAKLGLAELCNRCSTTTLEAFIEEYPIEELLKLQDFIVEYDIDDLHGHNAGWCNGKLKFIDYSGTNETTADFVRADFNKRKAVNA